MQIDFAKAIWGIDEQESVMNILLNNEWLASSEQNQLFEKEFAKYVGTNYAVCVNSGSSANLLAIMALQLPRHSKIITSGCGFPATLSPILHGGNIPILCDYVLDTHNADVNEVIALLEKDKYILAVILAHTLGNPIDLNEIDRLCCNKGIYLIEDCCEAVGSKVDGFSVGKFADISTFSFYPAHQITAGGGGGMLCTDNRDFYLRAKSLRDWGKVWNWDTKVGDIKTNFTTEVDGIPYYAGYTYETLGFNLKLPEICCAFGRKQLEMLDDFSNIRKINHDYLGYLLSNEERIMKVKSIDGASPSWFGFPLTLTIEGLRDKFVNHLETNGVRTRPFFAGNITRHKPFIQYKKDLPVADYLMRNSCFVGVHPGMGKKECEYIYETISSFFKTI